ncbi:MAG: hypothetical protein ACREO3_01595 [Arenimonas sp.]
MNRRRIALEALLLASLALIVWAVIDAQRAREADRERKQDAPRMASDAEQVALLRQLHATNSLARYANNELKLLDHSLRLCPPRQPQPRDCAARWITSQISDRRQWAGYPWTMRQALLSANSESRPLPDPRLVGVPVASVEDNAPLLEGDRPAWQVMRSKAMSLVRPARAVVSADGSQAMLLIALDIGPECGLAELHLFRRGAGGWERLERDRMMPWGDMRHPPPSPFPSTDCDLAPPPQT